MICLKFVYLLLLFFLTLTPTINFSCFVGFLGHQSVSSLRNIIKLHLLLLTKFCISFTMSIRPSVHPSVCVLNGLVCFKFFLQLYCLFLAVFYNMGHCLIFITTIILFVVQKTTFTTNFCVITIAHPFSFEYVIQRHKKQQKCLNFFQ